MLLDDMLLLIRRFACGAFFMGVPMVMFSAVAEIMFGFDRQATGLVVAFVIGSIAMAGHIKEY